MSATKAQQHQLFLRRLTRWAAVLGVAYLGLRHFWVKDAQPFDNTCPFGGIETLWRWVTTGTFLRTTAFSNLVLLAVLGIAALLTGRAFCGWVCPLGAVQDGLAWLIARLTRRGGRGRGSRLPVRALPAWLDRPLRWLKYVLLGLILWGSLTAVVPPLQPFCPYRTLFTLHLTSLINWSVLIGFVLLSLTVERFWCRYLCPLGAALSLFNAIAPWHVELHRERCVSCSLCARACPMGLEPHLMSPHNGECIRCLACTCACRREALEGCWSLSAGE